MYIVVDTDLRLIFIGYRGRGDGEWRGRGDGKGNPIMISRLLEERLT